MTHTNILELINRMQALEAKATILQDEAKAIRKILTDLAEPQSKRPKANIRKAMEKAEIQAQLEVVFEKMQKRLRHRKA